MGLKPILQSIEGLPEEIKKLYKAQDGEFVLDLEGDPPGYVPAARHAGFRDNNRKLAAEKEALEEQLAEVSKRLGQLKGIDPAEYTKMRERIAELEKAGAGSAPDVQDLVKRQVKAAIEGLQAEVASLKAENEKSKSEKEAAQQALQRKSLDSKLTQIAIKAGVSDFALDDFVRRGRDVFSPEGEAFVAKRADGSPWYDNVGEPLTPEGWAKELSKAAPHLFKGGSGGGATGEPAAKEVPAGTYNPNDPKDFLSKVEDIASGKLRPIA